MKRKKEFFDQLADTWEDQSFPAETRKRVAELVNRFDIHEGHRVLDVATGTGLVGRQIENIVGSAGYVVGLDPSIEMLRRARTGNARPVIQGLGEHLPCSDCRFDFLSMGYALRHLENVEQPFCEFHRVLKPGGRLCILEITVPEKKITRKLFRRHKIQYREIDIETSREGYRQYRALGGKGVPVVVVEDEIMHGYSESNRRQNYRHDKIPVRHGAADRILFHL